MVTNTIKPYMTRAKAAELLLDRLKAGEFDKDLDMKYAVMLAIKYLMECYRPR